MKTKQQSGFAHLSLFLLVLVLAVVAFAGYKVYSNQHKTSQVAQTAASSGTASVTVIKTQADLNKAVDTLNGQNLDGDLNPDQLNNDVNSLL